MAGVSITVNADPLDEPNANAGLFESGLIQTDAAINPGTQVDRWWTTRVS